MKLSDAWARKPLAAGDDAGPDLHGGVLVGLDATDAWSLGWHLNFGSPSFVTAGSTGGGAVPALPKAAAAEVGGAGVDALHPGDTGSAGHSWPSGGGASHGDAWLAFGSASAGEVVQPAASVGLAGAALNGAAASFVAALSIPAGAHDGADMLGGSSPDDVRPGDAWPNGGRSDAANPDDTWSDDVIHIDLTEPVDLDFDGVLTATVGSGAAITAVTSAATSATAQALQAAYATPLTVWTSGRDASLFNIEIDFTGSGWTVPLQQSFIKAALVLESFIKGDLSNTSVHTAGGTKQVDDIAITATLNAIDGVGGVLGSTGPTALRAGSYLPVLSKMTFDTADANALASNVQTMTKNGKVYTETQWDAVVEHEMMHALGYGTIWAYKGLVSGANYIGKAADLAYAQLLNPAATTGKPIPLETGGGAGTAGAHWSETVFKTELMTGFLNKAYAPISAMSVASLADLGYVLDSASHWKVDPFSL